MLCFIKIPKYNQAYTQSCTFLPSFSFAFIFACFFSCYSNPTQQRSNLTIGCVVLGCCQIRSRPVLSRFVPSCPIPVYPGVVSSCPMLAVRCTCCCPPPIPTLCPDLIQRKLNSILSQQAPVLSQSPKCDPTIHAQNPKCKYLHSISNTNLISPLTSVVFFSQCLSSACLPAPSLCFLLAIYSRRSFGIPS